jgi:hypothetical protein
MVRSIGGRKGRKGGKADINDEGNPLEGTKVVKSLGLKSGG